MIEENKHLDILFTGYIRRDDDGTFSCVLTISGMRDREDALKVGLEMSGPVDKVLGKIYGKFRKYDPLTRGHA